MATPAYLTDKNRQILYQKWALALPQYGGFRTAMEGMGVESMTTGAEKSTFMLQLGNGAATGFANDDGSTVSVSHLGNVTALRRTMAFTHSRLVTRTVIDWRRVADQRLAGDQGFFLAEEVENEKDAMRVHAQAWDATLIRGNRGKLCVATDAVTINAAATGTIQVDSVQYAAIGQPLQVLRGGSVVANNLLTITTYTDNGIGSGGMTVTNSGSSNYVGETGDTFIFAYGRDQNYIEGIDSDIGTNAYPTASIGNNESLDNPYYKSVVQSKGTEGNPATLTYEMLRILKRKVGEQLPYPQAMEQQIQNRNTGDLQAPMVWMMRPEFEDQLLFAFSQKRRQIEYEERVENGWGRSVIIDGLPVVKNNMLDENSVYLTYFPGFGARFQELTPLTGGLSGAYQHIPNTLQAEAIWMDAGVVACVARAAQGKLTNVSGLTDAA